SVSRDMNAGDGDAGEDVQTTQQEDPQQLHLLPRRQMQLQDQRPRQSQNNNIGSAVVPPIGRDGRALEDGGVEEDNPPAENEGGDAVGYEAEAAAGEEAIIEEEDGEFDEREGADVDDLESVDGLGTAEG
ncbi:MAG: hypothetical protein LQ347_006028, partial [Umbilicaria vellea]